jgi:hypothetical protein
MAKEQESMERKERVIQLKDKWLRSQQKARAKYEIERFKVIQEIREENLSYTLKKKP